MNTQPHDHIVKSYDEERHRLVNEILRMGEMSAAQLEAALDVVERRDDRAAARIVANDEAIDSLEHEVSQDVMKLALRGPLARDLREILASLRIASDIERIGDYAANVAKRSTALNASPPLPHVAGLRIPSDIERIGDYAANVAKRSIALNVSPPVPHTSSLRALGQLAARQVSDVLEAYRDGDADRALKVRARDAELDAQYTALFRELLTYMMEDARNITPCTHLLFMAKNLERIGDHATNIAENIWFLVHGDQPLPPRDKRDETSTAGSI